MNGVAHWGRCNGWVALAQTELLNNLPADHPKRAGTDQIIIAPDRWFLPLPGPNRYVAPDAG